jgi:hypothetical protein
VKEIRTLKAHLAAACTRLHTWHAMRWLIGAGAGAGAALLFGAAGAFAWDGQPGGTGSTYHPPPQQIAQRQVSTQAQSSRQNGLSVGSLNAANLDVAGRQSNQAGTFQDSSQHQGSGQLQAAAVDPPAISQRQGAAQLQSNRQNGASALSANALNADVAGRQNNQAGTFQNSSQRQGSGQAQLAAVDPPAISQRQGAAQLQSNRQNGASLISANVANLDLAGNQNNQAGTFQKSSQNQGIGQLQLA